MTLGINITGDVNCPKCGATEVEDKTKGWFVSC